MKLSTLLFIFFAFALSACAGPDMGTARKAYAEKDYSTAYAHYNELAEFGMPQAKTELGKMYLYGQGVPADPQKALELFTQADAMGDKRAAALIPKAQKKLLSHKVRLLKSQQRRQKAVMLREAENYVNNIENALISTPTSFSLAASTY